MAKDLKELFESLSTNYSLDHEDYTKCGMCWKNKIRADVASEFLKAGKTDESDLSPMYDEIDRRWENTSLYKEVQALRAQGNDLDKIAEIMLAKGIDI